MKNLHGYQDHISSLSWSLLIVIDIDFFKQATIDTDDSFSTLGIFYIFVK